MKNEKKMWIPKIGEVDIVYIWCDSNNTEYIKNKNFFSAKYNVDSYWSPTRDHDEITHSIKSVRRNMTWIRNIFICTPKNHKVKNLLEKKYNVKYISNEEILGEKNCPNFNSRSLELFTHKIKGLSDYFIQLNDDFFVNKKLELDDFYNFKTKKIKYFYENILFLGKKLSPTTRKCIQDLSGEKYYFWPTHSPRMFCKNDIQEIIESYKWVAEYTKKSKFRNKNDLQLVYFYGYYLLSQNRGEFIFLENIAYGKNFLYFIKLLTWKAFSEGFISVLHQIYLQLFYRKRLYANKIFSSEKCYSLIGVSNDYKRNRNSISFALENKVKFICLNDSYSTKDKSLLEKIDKENYKYFYKKLLTGEKKIVFIELLHHHECLENPYLFFKNKWFETKAILWEFVFRQLKNMSKYEDEFYVLKQPRRRLFSSLNFFQKIIYVFLSFWEIYKNTKKIKNIIEKEKPETLYINTIESPFSIPLILYLLRLKGIKIYLTIHNVNRLKVNFFKYFLFDFLINLLIKKAYRVVLLWEYLKFEDKNIQTKVIYLNNRAQKHINTQKFKKKTFVISGSLDYKTKDLESIFKGFGNFLKDNRNYENKIQLILLGQMNNKVANWIKIYKLTKIVKTFNHYVWEKDMEKYMSWAHYVIISTYKESIYGRYKISGSFGDAIGFNLPIILSENYAPDYKSKNIIRFRNENLSSVLEKILKYN